MKSLAILAHVLALALSLALVALPSLAQPRHDHGQRGGPPIEHRGGGDRRGPYGDPRGGYLEPRNAYPEPRGPYPDPRGAYGYPPPPEPYGYRRGPDSLGADWGGQQDEVRAGVRQGRYMGLARVIGTIRQHTPGRQLDAGLEQWGGRTVYRVRWAAPNGRRIDYIVDAQSGAILHVDGG